MIKKAAEASNESSIATPGSNASAMKCPLCRQNLTCIFNLSNNNEVDTDLNNNNSDGENNNTNNNQSVESDSDNDVFY